MRRSQLSVVAALSWFALPAAAVAQQHAAPPETLDAIAAAYAGALDADRAELRSFLQRPEVRRLAAEAGVDIETAQTAVASMSAAELGRLSGELARAEAALAGGDQVVISTTAIIIGLLILIIILVA